MALESGIDAAEAWRVIRGGAVNAKQYAQIYKAELSANSVTLERVFDMYRTLRNIHTQMTTMAAAPGLVDYVKSVRGDAAYDAAAAVSALLSALADTGTWINTNASSLTLSGDTAENWLSTGAVATNRFTPAQTAGLRTRLDAVIAAVN